MTRPTCTSSCRCARPPDRGTPSQPRAAAAGPAECLSAASPSTASAATSTSSSSLGDGPHVVVGRNAAGKTNLVESLVVLSSGRSHRSSRGHRAGALGRAVRPRSGTRGERRPKGGAGGRGPRQGRWTGRPQARPRQRCQPPRLCPLARAAHGPVRPRGHAADRRLALAARGTCSTGWCSSASRPRPR